jgi:Ca2+-binding RTX toxin-like protein
VGALRAQDVIELAPGLTVADYTTTVDGNGTTTLASATHTITYVGSGTPIVREHTEDETPGGIPGNTGAPVANPDSFTVRKGEVLTLTAAALLGNDVDPENEPLSLVSVDEDEHSTVVLHDDGTLTFTPKPGYTGVASFTYMVADGQGGYAEGTVSVTVQDDGHSEPGQPPAAQIPPAAPLPPVDQEHRGGHGHDKLWGGEGQDRLHGGDGHDRLHGGSGADRMWGGRGHDVYYVDQAGDRVYESRHQGTDTVSASVSYTLGAHVEKLVLSGAADLKGIGNSLDNILKGNAGHNVLKGEAGQDVLKGMDGNDKLYGGLGNDYLSGGSGHDRLYGGSGNDKLAGGTGNDWLTGGTGRDLFVFEEGGGRDTVTDFRDGQDRIDARRLSGVDDLSDLSLAQVGSSTVIGHGDEVLVLKGVLASDLDQTDFIF